MSEHKRNRSYLVEVATLRRQLGLERRLVVEECLSGLEVPGSSVPSDETVRLDVRLQSVSEGIFVTGTVTASFVSTCRRCLEEVRGRLVATLEELFVEEVANPDDELYTFSHDELDVEPLTRDACILELPLTALCRENCLGLSAICGINRNVEPCSCVPERDHRFAALSVLESDTYDEADATTR